MFGALVFLELAVLAGVAVVIHVFRRRAVAAEGGLAQGDPWGEETGPIEMRVSGLIRVSASPAGGIWWGGLAAAVYGVAAIPAAVSLYLQGSGALTFVLLVPAIAPLAALVGVRGTHTLGIAGAASVAVVVGVMLPTLMSAGSGDLAAVPIVVVMALVAPATMIATAGAASSQEHGRSARQA